ncbi:MAG: disulfide bond formation protein DsbB [Nitrobacter sp. 62-23]|nr:MAG: disulfide bond formation protein DsbB [Nitrobacter sp. 62-23]
MSASEAASRSPAMTPDAAATTTPAARGKKTAFAVSLAVAFIATATIAGAWYFQLVLKILPCPLCLEQRYAYYLAIPLSLFVAFIAAKGAPRCLIMPGLVVLALVALGNAGLGAYHAGVEWGYWPGPTDCTGPVLDLGKAGLLDNLDNVRVVRCDEVQWRFLGLSLAGYNALISLLMAALAGWGVAALAGKVR